MKFHDCTIQQIIPADGWKATWEDLDNDNRDAYTKPLVCWALVESPRGDTFITGLDAEPGSTAGFVAADDNFLGYVSPEGEQFGPTINSEQTTTTT